MRRSCRVTEIMTPQHVEMICRYADILQIGARNMQNYHLLQAVGESSQPVLLKRGPAATMDEFPLAAEYVLDQGNKQVVLMAGNPHFRGAHAAQRPAGEPFPTCTSGRICRSSSTPATDGIASLVPAMPRCMRRIAIEVHPDPTALSDGDQSITPAVSRQDHGRLPQSGGRPGTLLRSIEQVNGRRGAGRGGKVSLLFFAPQVQRGDGDRRSELP